MTLNRCAVTANSLVVLNFHSDHGDQAIYRIVTILCHFLCVIDLFCNNGNKTTSAGTVAVYFMHGWTYRLCSRSVPKRT